MKFWTLTVFNSSDTSGRGSSRLKTRGGHFELPSFSYLGLVQFEPTMSEFGVRIALPLHHPKIGAAEMGQLFAGRKIKRSNKDLGRVVALAYLVDREDEDALETWPSRWQMAVKELAPEQSEQLLGRASDGLHALLNSPSDIEQALHTVNNGLMSATPLRAEQFVIALRRLLKALS